MSEALIDLVTKSFDLVRSSFHFLMGRLFSLFLTRSGSSEWKDFVQLCEGTPADESDRLLWMSFTPISPRCLESIMDLAR